MKVFRDGEIKSISIRAIEVPPEYIDRLILKNFGIKVINNSSTTARRNNLYSSSGIVISEIRQNSQAYESGLHPGDIILKVQTKAVNSVSEFKKQLINNIHMDSILLFVQRGRYGYYLNFNM